jgi:hypothetical protein
MPERVFKKSVVLEHHATLTACMDSLMDSLVQLQAGLAMNGIFEVLGENKKYIEFYNTARARRPRARADHAT